MATTQFKINEVRYTPSEPVVYNGVKGRFWTARKLVGGSWVLTGKVFAGERETRRDIAQLLFEGDDDWNKSSQPYSRW